MMQEHAHGKPKITKTTGTAQGSKTRTDNGTAIRNIRNDRAATNTNLNGRNLRNSSFCTRL